jgi:hypothetical protein
MPPFAGMTVAGWPAIELAGKAGLGFGGWGSIGREVVTVLVVPVLGKFVLEPRSQQPSEATAQHIERESSSARRRTFHPARIFRAVAANGAARMAERSEEGKRAREKP